MRRAMSCAGSSPSASADAGRICAAVGMRRTSRRPAPARAGRRDGVERGEVLGLVPEPPGREHVVAACRRGGTASRCAPLGSTRAALAAVVGARRCAASPRSARRPGRRLQGPRPRAPGIRVPGRGRRPARARRATTRARTNAPPRSLGAWKGRAPKANWFRCTRSGRSSRSSAEQPVAGRGRRRPTGRPSTRAATRLSCSARPRQPAHLQALVRAQRRAHGGQVHLDAAARRGRAPARPRRSRRRRRCRRSSAAVGRCSPAIDAVHHAWPPAPAIRSRARSARRPARRRAQSTHRAAAPGVGRLGQHRACACRRSARRRSRRTSRRGCAAPRRPACRGSGLRSPRRGRRRVPTSRRAAPRRRSRGRTGPSA